MSQGKSRRIPATAHWHGFSFSFRASCMSASIAPPPLTLEGAAPSAPWHSSSTPNQQALAASPVVLGCPRSEFFNHGFHGLTRIGTKQFGPTENSELIRYANTGAFFKRCSQASLPMLLQNASPLVISRKARKAGPLAKRVSDSETGESASLLARESGSEAPAQVPWASPCCPSVYIRVIRGSNAFSKFNFSR